MTAALAVVGGATLASTALATERAADTNDARAVEEGEGSGDAVEGREDFTCKPWMCPQPLYGVMPIDDFELRQDDGGGEGTTDEATDGSSERG